MGQIDFQPLTPSGGGGAGGGTGGGIDFQPITTPQPGIPSALQRFLSGVYTNDKPQGLAGAVGRGILPVGLGTIPALVGQPEAAPAGFAAGEGIRQALASWMHPDKPAPAADIVRDVGWQAAAPMAAEIGGAAVKPVLNGIGGMGKAITSTLSGVPRPALEAAAADPEIATKATELGEQLPVHAENFKNAISDNLTQAEGAYNSAKDSILKQKASQIATASTHAAALKQAILDNVDKAKTAYALAKEDILGSGKYSDIKIQIPKELEDDIQEIRKSFGVPEPKGVPIAETKNPILNEFGAPIQSVAEQITKSSGPRVQGMSSTQAATLNSAISTIKSLPNASAEEAHNLQKYLGALSSENKGTPLGAALTRLDESVNRALENHIPEIAEQNAPYSKALGLRDLAEKKGILSADNLPGKVASAYAKNTETKAALEKLAAEVPGVKAALNGIHGANAAQDFVNDVPEQIPEINKATTQAYLKAKSLADLAKKNGISGTKNLPQLMATAYGKNTETKAAFEKLANEIPGARAALENMRKSWAASKIAAPTGFARTGLTGGILGLVGKAAGGDMGALATAAPSIALSSPKVAGLVAAGLGAAGRSPIVGAIPPILKTIAGQALAQNASPNGVNMGPTNPDLQGWLKAGNLVNPGKSGSYKGALKGLPGTSASGRRSLQDFAERFTNGDEDQAIKLLKGLK